jgi:PTH2 family peptidyl-tRNA hydrolase
MSDYKQVIVIREDLKLSPGKAAAQACHVSLGAYQNAVAKRKNEFLEGWTSTGTTKVVLGVADEKTLLDLFQKVHASGLPAAITRDAGRTEVASGTVTAIAVGPAPATEIDKITAQLKLYKGS